MSTPLQKAERAAGQPGLAETLGALDASVLSSLLLDVAARQASRRSPATIQRQASADPFTRPSDLDQRTLLRLDHAIATHLPATFQAVELSPLCPLGTVSQLATAHQNKVLATTRSVEVLADPSNALALIVAERRARGEAVVRLCTSSRVVRTPRVTNKGFTQHFRLWAFVTGGRDPGGRSFEAAALREHMGLHETVLDALREAGLPIPVPAWTVRTSPEHQAWVERALDGAPVTLLPLEGNYYQGARINLSLRLGEQELPVSDGGLVDWTAKLRSNRKERLFISAIGTELLVRLFGG